MGILGRLKAIAAADVNGLLDRMEDPVHMARQHIRKVEEQLDAVREALAGQHAAVQQLELLIARAGDVIDKRNRQALLAVEHENEQVAQLAVQDKLHHQKLLVTYTGQRETLNQQANVLRQEETRISELLRELQTRLFFLTARAHAAHAMHTAAGAVPQLHTDRIMRSFSRLEECVMRQEAGAQIYSPDSTGSPSAVLSRLDEEEEIRAELERLKAEQKAGLEHK
ncbi:PspA/IM30 family protein [Paenibacillus tarimensis]|uniref:PspA/IM30 family protein n=1 Tax=Paenibacillus tarimensis TaxID=416012 RepID=UPI001F1EEA0F|nr:PspA/IM30 family protein [Paenibacillus tarimensis]MCF2941997.1 PspA/IM30 family protein [Paenibacillus tarimensis]